jgi:tetraacyldisaccharide 4'-kinase
MISALSTYWRELAKGTRTGLSDRLLIMLLTPFSFAYSLIQRLRAALYQTGILRSGRLPRPVISVGNITAGGTGKTPVTAHIARILMDQGHRVAVLSRGYGGSLEGHAVVVSDGATVMLGPGECGDEPFLLASTLPGLMVVIGTDRYAAGMLAMQQLRPDLFLLDDGFQHLQLHRDLNILLLDCSRPFGNGWSLPSGLLREPASAVQRADLVIHTRSPEGSVSASTVKGIPNCFARHRITDLVPFSGAPTTLASTLSEKRVLAFAGIAEPTHFFDELRALGLNLVHTLRFPDHTPYGETDVSLIMDALRRYGAELAITTEKDGVKLRTKWPGTDEKILLARLELTFDDPVPLTDSLRNLLQKY